MDLCTIDPRLRGLIEKEIDELGEILPHVFLPEIANWLTELDAEDPADHLVIAEVLSVIETGLVDGPASVRNVIELSFLDAALRTGAWPALIRDQMGSTSARFVSENGL